MEYKYKQIDTLNRVIKTYNEKGQISMSAKDKSIVDLASDKLLILLNEIQ